MIEVIREVLDFQVPMLIYSSVKETDDAAGKEGACLAECNNNLMYRGSYAEARDLIWSIVEELTGVKPKTDTKTVGDKVVIFISEKESVYVTRALATVPSVTKDEVQGLVTLRARGYTKEVDGKEVEIEPIAVDIRQRARVGKAKALPELYLNKAKLVIANGNQAKWATKFGITLSGDTVKDTETLGWAIRADVLRREKEALESMQ